MPSEKDVFPHAQRRLFLTDRYQARTGCRRVRGLRHRSWGTLRLRDYSPPQHRSHMPASRSSTPHSNHTSEEEGEHMLKNEGQRSSHDVRNLGAQKQSAAYGAVDNHTKHAAALSCVVYSFCSITMVLANKGLASRYPTGIDFITIALQSLCAVVLVLSCDAVGAIQLGTKFQKDVALKWLPVNTLFVAMLFTGFLSLTHLNVPMVTIFKNLTNVGIMYGEWFFYGQHVSLGAVASCAVMVCGAVLAAANDITFSAMGYFWMVANCLCTAGYVLYMKHATKTIRISKFGMVLYNNLLSIPILVVGAVVRGEFSLFFSRPEYYTAAYAILSLYAGLVGFFLNMATLWCVSTNTATTYAVVGALNKIPLAIVGWLLFKTPMTTQTMVFISVSMLGGFMYTAAKLTEAKQQAQKLPK